MHRAAAIRIQAGVLGLAHALGIFGGRCRRCGAAPELGGTLCDACSLALQPRTGGYCPDCGAIYTQESAPVSRCAACRKSPPPWSGVVFHSVYPSALGELVLELKYGRRLSRAAIITGCMAAACQKAGVAVDVVAPVPLHPKRLRSRGFNQSAVLARPLARRIGAAYATAGLRRVRDTPPQASLPRRARQENIKGAFVADKEIVSGRRVLLVDDIMTTGATLREASRTLLKAGAQSVTLCIAARA